MPTADDFREALKKLFDQALRNGNSEIVICSGEFHKSVGWYPGKNHRMPTCCSVMKSAMTDGDVILSEPKKGKGATLIIQYQLPRSS